MFNPKIIFATAVSVLTLALFAQVTSGPAGGGTNSGGNATNAVSLLQFNGGASLSNAVVITIQNANAVTSGVSVVQSGQNVTYTLRNNTNALGASGGTAQNLTINNTNSGHIWSGTNSPAFAAYDTSVGGLGFPLQILRTSGRQVAWFGTDEEESQGVKIITTNNGAGVLAAIDGYNYQGASGAGLTWALSLQHDGGAPLYVGAKSDDGSGAQLQVHGDVSASGSYYGDGSHLTGVATGSGGLPGDGTTLRTNGATQLYVTGTLTNGLTVTGGGASGIWNTNGAYVGTNTTTSAFFQIGTNSHITTTDQVGTQFKTGTNSMSLTALNGQQFLYSNNDLTIGGTMGATAYTGDGSQLTGIVASSIPDDTYRITRFTPNGTSTIPQLEGETYSYSGNADGDVARAGVQAYFSAFSGTGANTAAGVSANANYTLLPLKNLYWSTHVTLSSSNSVRHKIGVTHASLGTEVAVDGSDGTHSSATFRLTTGDTTWKIIYGSEAGTTRTNNTGVAFTANHQYFFELQWDNANSRVLAYIDGALVDTDTACVPTNTMQSCVSLSNLSAISQTNKVHGIFARQTW